MKCPHCERTWNDADLGHAGLPGSVVLADHVGRFCPGIPVQGHRPVAVRRR